MPLLDHQVAPTAHLVKVLSEHSCSLDASDTGTGKTYVAAHLCLQLGLQPLVLCPKSVITGWRTVLAEVGVDPLDILNPEKLKTGKTEWLVKKSKKNFSWTLPKGDRDLILLFDEAHQYGAPDSQNARIMAFAKSTGVKIHLMSATLAETPLRLRAPGYLLGLHTFSNFYDWAARNGCYRNPWNGMEFSKGKKGLEAMKRIHDQLFPSRGVRVSIADIPDFPTATIQPEVYDLEEIAEIRRIYEEMEEEIRDEDAPSNPLTALLRARQKVEMFKVPLVADLAFEHLEENHSVVIFTNFRDTFSKLEEIFTDRGIAVSRILGGQDQETRDWNQSEFQENRRYVCLAMIQAGGQSISLHDLYGRPRVSLILPPVTARELKQALGRTHRAKSKSPAIQKILFAAGYPEEDISKMVKRKLNSLELLNDGDLSGGILT